MSCDQSARILIKQGSGVPTIPASTDHRNGDWIATDIYEGELYMDTDTGLVYTSNGGIIQMADGRTKQAVWKASITQTGVSAPSLTVLENTLGVTITPTYTSVGNYALTGFSSLLTGSFEMSIDYNVGPTKHAAVYNTTSSVMLVQTHDGGVVTDGVLGGTTVHTITVVKY